MSDSDNGERQFEADAMRPPGMLMSDSPKLMDVVARIEDHLKEIRRHFKGDYRFTLLARNVDYDDGARDFTITDDSLETAAAAMTRQKGYATGRFPFTAGDIIYGEEESRELRDVVKKVRDEALRQNDFAQTVGLSHVVAWMESAIEALKK